jgi:cyclic pyranopterin phosphate synthase
MESPAGARGENEGVESKTRAVTANVFPSHNRQFSPLPDRKGHRYFFPMSELTHFDESGAARMVDTSGKPETQREARASALVRMNPATLALIRGGGVAKGDVLAVARLAGIMAAKRTGELIPLCHPLPITSATVDFSFPSDDILRIETTVRVFGRTGVEMEALTAASVAALTVYDMCKSVDRVMSVERIRLESKSGGRSGDFQAAD